MAALRSRGQWFRSHSVELAARGGNLLDAKLTKLGLELAELLGQLILVLGPELTGLDLARRLHFVSIRIPPDSVEC